MQNAGALFKNRNTVFFFFLALLAVLIMFAWQQSSSQQAQFARDRQLYAASIQAYTQSDNQKALDYLQASSEPFQQDWNYYYLLGSIYLEMSNYGEADRCLQQVEERAPMVLTMSEFLTKRGQVFIHQKQKNDAIEYLNHSYTVAETEEERQYIKSLISQAESLPE